MPSVVTVGRPEVPTSRFDGIPPRGAAADESLHTRPAAFTATAFPAGPLPAGTAG
jgi:hypothetical protein